MRWNSRALLCNRRCKNASILRCVCRLMFCENPIKHRSIRTLSMSCRLCCIESLRHTSLLTLSFSLVIRLLPDAEAFKLTLCACVGKASSTVPLPAAVLQDELYLLDNYFNLLLARIWWAGRALHSRGPPAKPFATTLHDGICGSFTPSIGISNEERNHTSKWCTETSRNLIQNHQLKG